MSNNATTILLVEDNAADARYAEELLPPPNYSFIQAKSLSQALDCVREKHVDVVLLDLSLPDSTGLKTIETISTQRKELPIVVLTGLDDMTCAIEALRVGAHDYIVKARLSAEALSRSINSAIEAKKRQRTEQGLLDRTHLSDLAADVGRSLMRATSLPEMLLGCTDAIVEHMTAASAQIWTVDDRDQVLVLQSGSGACPAIDDGQVRIPIGKFTMGLIASERKAHVSNAVHQEPGIADPEWIKSEGMVAFAGHPLLVGDRLVGALAMFAREPLSNISISGLSAIADQIALGIARSIAEESLAHLATIVECSDDAIISRSLDGIILSWNPAAERIFGFSADEVIGHNITLLTPSGESDYLPRIMERLKRGEHIEPYERTLLRKDGTVAYMSWTLSPIKDSLGTIAGASAIVRDISKPKRSERLDFAQHDVTRILSESESIAAASAGILVVLAKIIPCEIAAIWCLSHEPQVLKCVDVWHGSDPSLTEFAALSRHITFPADTGLPGRILASGKSSWIPDLATDSNFPRLHAAARGGLRSAAGFPILLGAKALGCMEFFSRQGQVPDDELIRVMANIGAQIGQFIVRKQAEEAASRATQAQLKIGQAIMENAPIGVVWLDRNLVISEANYAFSQQFGVDRKELPGRFIFQIPTGISNERLVDVVEQGLPYSATNFPITLSGAQGPKNAFCDLTIWPVKDEDDRPVGLVILTVEVTERVRLAKQREVFVATLTHDLKNPLIGQDRMLELILAGQLGPLQSEQAEMLSLLRTGTRELLELIGTLLEVYRYEEGEAQLHCEQLDAAHLLSGCIAQVKPIAEAKGVKITSKFPEVLDALIGDAMALRRVVANLLDNAVKFTPAGGLIQVSCQSADSRFFITVEDTGPGVSADELRSLFQRFTQTGSGRRHKAGTGLGLYLCRQIVEAHGGKITCTTAEGEGATFVISLPLVSVYSVQYSCSK